MASPYHMNRAYKEMWEAGDSRGRSCHACICWVPALMVPTEIWQKAAQGKSCKNLFRLTNCPSNRRIKGGCWETRSLRRDRIRNSSTDCGDTPDSRGSSPPRPRLGHYWWAGFPMPILLRKRTKSRRPDDETATPYSRTLALQPFGDMDVSIIDWCPWRKEIITRQSHEQLAVSTG